MTEELPLIYKKITKFTIDNQEKEITEQTVKDHDIEKAKKIFKELWGNK